MSRLSISERSFFCIAFLLAIWIAFSRLYIFLRYGTRWSEWDTGSMAVIIRSNLASASLTNSEFTYSGGPGYPFTSISLIYTTGIDVIAHQLFLASLIGALPLLIALVLYRRYSGHRTRHAVILLFLLSVFSYFLIITRDGTHDKYSISLILIVFLSAYVISKRGVNRVSWAIVLILSLTGVALYNVFVSTALVVILGVGFLVSSLVFVRPELVRGFSTRLLRNGVLLLVATAILVLWAYPPSFRFLRDTVGTFSVVTTVIFGTQSPPATQLPYEFVASAYRSSAVYAFLSAYQWGMLGLSVIGWTLLTAIILKTPHRLDLADRHLYTWFSSFGFLGLLGLMIDFVQGSHWQIRVFGLGVVFIPPMVMVLPKFFSSLHLEGLKSLFLTLLSVLSLVGVAALPMSSIGEPLVMNSSPHFKQGEMVAMEWAAAKGAGTFSNDPFLRIVSVWNLHQPVEKVSSLEFESGHRATYLLLSSYTRWTCPEPCLNVYTNGDADIQISLHER